MEQNKEKINPSKFPDAKYRKDQQMFRIWWNFEGGQFLITNNVILDK